MTDEIDLNEWDWEAHTLRRETGLIEHTCPHGTGHPNPGSAVWVAEAYGHPTGTQDEDNPWNVHGCDGCCGHPTFPTMTDSLIHAHQLIRDLNEYIKKLQDQLADAELL
jgi:hypothetical protein